jgi:hypothetical protein
MIGILDHKWGVSPAQDRVWAQVSGVAPHKAGQRIFVILQAFIDDSYRKEGLFVLGGYIASAEAWAAFSNEWETALPSFGTRKKNGKYHFKMSEMAGLRLLHRVPAFYDIIERHVLCSLACKIDLIQLERAKERVWIEDTPIIWGFLDNPFLTCFRFLLDNFHQVRIAPPEGAPQFISRLTPPDKVIDFYFDEHSSKSAIISVWDEFVATRLEHVRQLYGATPRFENDDDFLPLQAADFWAWWVRKGFEENLLDQIMLVRLTPKSTRFGDDFVGTLAHWMLARLSPLHFGCCHEPVYSPSYVGATACPLIPSNDRNALNG